MQTLINNSSLFWFLAGIILMLLEFLIPGFVIFFFGIGAVITAGLSWAGVIDSFTIQVLVFLAVSLLTLLLFRKRGKKYFTGGVTKPTDEGRLSDEIIGEKVLVTEEVNPGKLTGKVELHGTNWNATSDSIIAIGDMVIISGRKDLTLTVKKS